MGEYAVNLVRMAELRQEPAGLPLLWLLQGIVTQVAIPTLDDMGHTALLVRDDVNEERWKAIVELVRKRYRAWEFPLYEKCKGRWRYVR